MRGTAPLLAIAALLALAGCDQRDPYLRTDVWKPTGSNAANIAAMVANPEDLIHGRGAIIEEANEPALAVGHVVTDTPKPLSQSQGSNSLSSTAGGGSGGGGSGGGGSGS